MSHQMTICMREKKMTCKNRVYLNKLWKNSTENWLQTKWIDEVERITNGFFSDFCLFTIEFLSSNGFGKSLNCNSMSPNVCWHKGQIDTQAKLGNALAVMETHTISYKQMPNFAGTKEFFLGRQSRKNERLVQICRHKIH